MVRVTLVRQNIYYVVLQGISSKVIHVICSVPEGSALCPLLFILPTPTLLSWPPSLVLCFMLLLMTTNSTYTVERRRFIRHRQLSNTVSTPSAAANRLKLNKDKTVLIWSGTEKTPQRLLSRGIPLTLGDDHTAVADSVRVLRMLVTSDLLLNQSINQSRLQFQLTSHNETEQNTS